MGDPRAAIKFHKETLALDPNHRLTLIQLSVAYRDIGEYEKWFELWKRTSRYDDDDIAEIDSVFQEEGYLAATDMITKLEEEAADEKQINISGHVNRYLELGQNDKAMDWLEKGYEIHHPSMPYILSRWDQLHDNPRYIALLKKMNLPIPKN
jgi:tetratricopeptide (TPR) repeat protein